MTPIQRLLLWALGLFILGITEFVIDQYQKLVLSRLKFWQSVFFQLLNQYFTFFVNIYMVGAGMDFWSALKEGRYELGTIFPYLAYIHGCVVGTAVAVVVFRAVKKKDAKDKNLKFLEKGRKVQKKLNKLKTEYTVDIEEVFDPIEQEDLKEEIKERVTQQISDKVAESVAQAFSPQVEEEPDAPKDISDKTSSDNGGTQETKH